MDGTAENRQGSLASSRPVCHGDSVAPAAQEQQPPDPQPDGSHDTGSWGHFVPQLQPSSAAVSAVVHWHRGLYLRTAFVLTWFKIKERQASASELLRTLKLLCRKGCPFQQVVVLMEISL